jgi:hypothetical protein
MTARQGNRYGLLFGVNLAMSWVLTNAIFAMALWTFRDQPTARLGAFASLWLFTVLAPTTTALRLHRLLGELAGASPDLPGAAMKELALMRSVLLILGTMATLSALALIVGPAQ